MLCSRVQKEQQSHDNQYLLAGGSTEVRLPHEQLLTFLSLWPEYIQKWYFRTDWCRHRNNMQVSVFPCQCVWFAYKQCYCRVGIYFLCSGTSVPVNRTSHSLQWDTHTGANTKRVNHREEALAPLLNSKVFWRLILFSLEDNDQTSLSVLSYFLWLIAEILFTTTYISYLTSPKMWWFLYFDS